ncbi:MAG: EthD domain-containing protein [Myxococcota bacterium]
MEKLIYLVGGRRGLDVASFREELLENLGPQLVRLGARRLTMNVADLDAVYGPDVAATIPINDALGVLDASISFWLDSIDQRGPIEERIASSVERRCGYLVTESVPIEYPAVDWPRGTRSPGITIVAVFPKPEWISDEDFYDRWHGSHTPLSLEIHPLTRYLRHTVCRALTPGAPVFRAIVEERVGCLEDLTDEARFYGGPAGRARVHADLATFLDGEQCQSMAMSEYLLS